MGEHDEPTLIACNSCGEEVPVERIARPWDCTCADCDELDEAFSELLEPDEAMQVARVHQTRAAGYPWCKGLWITVSGCPGKRIPTSLAQIMWMAGSTAVHPHDWPSHHRITIELRGLYMSHDDHLARAK